VDISGYQYEGIVTFLPMVPDDVPGDLLRRTVDI
jgi:hypothetical protein